MAAGVQAQGQPLRRAVFLDRDLNSVPNRDQVTGFAAVAGGRLRVNVSNAVDLGVPGTEVTLAVRGNVYRQVAAFPPAPDDRGTFTVQTDHVIFTPDFGPPLDGAHPLQLIVNGAEAQPFWVEI